MDNITVYCPTSVVLANTLSQSTSSHVTALPAGWLHSTSDQRKTSPIYNNDTLSRLSIPQAIEWVCQTLCTPNLNPFFNRFNFQYMSHQFQTHCLWMWTLMPNFPLPPPPPLQYSSQENYSLKMAKSYVVPTFHIHLADLYLLPLPECDHYFIFFIWCPSNTTGFWDLVKLNKWAIVYYLFMIVTMQDLATNKKLAM